MGYLNLGNDYSSNKRNNGSRSTFGSDLGEFVKDLAKGAAAGVGVGAFALAIGSGLVGSFEGSMKAQQRYGMTVNGAYDMNAAADFTIDHWEKFLAAGLAGGVIAGYLLNKQR